MNRLKKIFSFRYWSNKLEIIQAKKKLRDIDCNETFCYFQHEGKCLLTFDTQLIGEIKIGIPKERCNVLKK